MMSELLINRPEYSLTKVQILKTYLGFCQIGNTYRNVEDITGPHWQRHKIVVVPIIIHFRLQQYDRNSPDGIEAEKRLETSRYAGQYSEMD